MKFIDGSFEIIEQKDGLDGLYEHIEKCARISYKSEDKIAKGSAKRMVDMLMKSNHGAALEHGTIYLKDSYEVGQSLYSEYHLLVNKYKENPYSKVIQSRDKNIVTNYITTNYRVLFENNWLNDLYFMCEPTEYHEKRYSVKFICSIGIAREFLRHRSMSMIQESTRYCNYSKEKFNSELIFVIPQWIYKLRNYLADCIDWVTGDKRTDLLELTGEHLVNQLTCEDRSASSYVDLLRHIERDYMFYINSEESHKLKPEEARGVLPLDLKTEIILTGFSDAWINFFNLRSHISMTGKPHPDAQILADPLLIEFLSRGYINEDQLYKKDKVVNTENNVSS